MTIVWTGEEQIVTVDHKRADAPHCPHHTQDRGSAAPAAPGEDDAYQLERVRARQNRNAGRRRDWPDLTLVSTLSPCIMCTGTALLYRIPRVIVGENRNFMGAEDLFRRNGIEVVVLDDAECIRMMGDFIRDHADLWNEDIGK